MTCTTGTLNGNTIATTNLISSLTGYLKQATGLSPAYYNTGRNIFLGCDSTKNSYIDFHCLDTGTGNPGVRIQAFSATVGSNFTGQLTTYCSGVWFNSWVNMGTNTFTCGAITCGGTLTCGTNSLSMTDGTGSFSVTPIMMRALYTYQTSLGSISTTVGTLTNYTAGNPSQNTGTSGSWNTNAIVSVSLGAGSYMVYAFVLMIYNNSGNPTITNMKVALSTSTTTNDSYHGYTSLAVNFTVTSSTPYFFPYQVSRQLKFTSTTTINLICAPTQTGNANALAYDASCALQVMRIA